MEKKEVLPQYKLAVPFLPLQAEDDLAAVASLLRGVQKHTLSHAPWAETYPAKPFVQFAVAFNDHSLYLQYDVEEEFIRALHGRANEAVYEDSCVEFFISLDKGETYYNFEFNCIGTVLASYGRSKQDRQFLTEDLLKRVECQSTIRRGASRPFVAWQLTVIIPTAVFASHPSFSFSSESCTANFYKCGDKLPEPHFLCWSPVQHETPNFHLPLYFGTLAFAKGEDDGRNDLLQSGGVII